MAPVVPLLCPQSSRAVQSVRRRSQCCYAAASPSVTWPLSGKSSEIPSTANIIAPAAGLRQRVDRSGLSTHPQDNGFGSASRVDSPVTGPANQLSGSHTRPAHAPTAAHGCYRVIGPARISRRGDTLVAQLQPGSRLEFIDRHGSPSCCVTLEQLLPPDAREQYLSSLSSACSMDISPMTPMELSRSRGHVSNNNSDCASSAGNTLASGSSCAFTPLDVWSLSGECVLVGTHVELGGSASSVDLVDVSVQPAVHHHHGRTYLSVRALPPHTVIQLDGDAELRHPVNVTPLEQDSSNSSNSNGNSSSSHGNSNRNGNGHLYQRT